MLDQWYYLEAGKETGPVTLVKLNQLLAAGDLCLEDQVWQMGTPDWRVIKGIPGLGDRSALGSSSDGSISEDRREEVDTRYSASVQGGDQPQSASNELFPKRIANEYAGEVVPSRLDDIGRPPPSSAQNRKLGLFLCSAGIACFLFAWLAFRFGRIAVGMGLIGAVLFVLGLVGIIFGRLPLEFLDRFFGE